MVSALPVKLADRLGRLPTARLVVRAADVFVAVTTIRDNSLASIRRVQLV